MQELKPGDVVRVRGDRWQIVDVRAYTACQVLTLASISPRHAGATRRILSPFDLVERIERTNRPRKVGTRCWRLACGQLLAAEAPPGAIRSARGARMELLPHQLEPALAVLRGLGSRLLLADDVGLGKTLQAGLVASELQARGWADRILILTPAALREQWASELATRLAMEAAILDAAEVRRLLAQLPVGLNPWTTQPVVIASIDYVKRPEVLPAVSACRWDIVIIDEAHGVTADSDRYAAADALAGRAAYVLLLTATPHSGDRRAFSSLCGIGRQRQDSLLVFRRSRADAGFALTRNVHRLHVRASAAERRMHALLDRFARAVSHEHGEAAALGLSVLRKRAFSSAHSLARSVARRLTALSGVASESDCGAFQFALPLDEEPGDLNPADEPPSWSAELALADGWQERRLLGALHDAAAEASRDETKIRVLRRLLRRSTEPALIFTEYRDTLLHLRDSLARPVLVLHGGLNRDERAFALGEFAAGRSRVLLATDAAGEGLNLHQACRLVVNLELPWNPMRLEQRIGRVDRIGQRRPVHVVHLIARQTGESSLLARLRERVVRARAEIDAPDPIGVNGDRGAIERIEGCVFPTLTLEAVAEAGRLANARAVPERGGALMMMRPPWLMRARHRLTRARLRGRLLLIFQSALEDNSGRVVDSTLVSMAVTTARLPSGLSSLDSIRRCLPPIEEELTRHVETASSDWRAFSEQLNGAFTSIRLQREHAIGGALAARTAPGLQPGLFDRRAQMASDVGASANQEDLLEQTRRIARLEGAATLSFRTRLLLILGP